MQTKKELVHDYQLLKNKLEDTLMLVDFLKYGSRDPWLYIKKYKSYYNFIYSIENNFESIKIKQNINLLELFSLEINNGKRVEESMILKKLINNKKYSIKDLSIDMKERFKNKVSEQTIESRYK